MCPKCASCLHKQCLNEILLATNNKNLQDRAIGEVDKILEKMGTKEYISAMVGTLVHKKVYEITQNPDPYKNLKSVSNEHAMELLSQLKKELENYNDKLLFGLNIAATGNIVEFGVPEHNFTIDELKTNFLRSLKSSFAIDHRKKIIEAIKNAKKILYVTDNSGEIVFDMYFIEQILNKGKTVIVAVKDEPISNDATMQDAKQVGLDKITKVITTGVASIGVDPDKASDELLEELKSSDLIISKGMGNFEWFEEYIDKYNVPIAYLFRTKCNIIADKLKTKKDQNIALFFENK